MPRFLPPLAGAGVVVMAVVLALNIGLIPGPGATPTPSQSTAPLLTASPSVQPSSLTPVVCGKPTGEPGIVLDCSRDGTRVLIQRADENLFILHADGSETQVTEQLTGLGFVPGSGRPSGATISPDGLGVVFAGLTKTPEEGGWCHNGALFAVSADGGPAEVLWESQVPQNGIVRYPTFSPDGTQIAFADGYCDSDHSVWLMNADGSEAHQILSSDIGPLSATHVRGLAWSAAGDRIALTVDQGTYVFATDGSDFTKDGASGFYCWPGRRC